MITHNLSQIVSINYNAEHINSDYQLEEYRSFTEWILRKPKRTIVRFFGLVPPSIIIELKNLSENLFIRDNKVWRKASLTFRFSDGTRKTSYFINNQQALKCKELIESNNYINL